MICEYKREKKIKNYKNYNNNNKTKLKIVSNVIGQYLYSRAKPLAYAINDYFSFFLLKILDNDVRSEDTIRSIIAFAIR